MTDYDAEIATVTASSLPQVAKDAAIAALTEAKHVAELAANIAAINATSLPQAAKDAALAALRPAPITATGRGRRGNGGNASLHPYNDYAAPDNAVISLRVAPTTRGAKHATQYANLRDGMTIAQARAAGTDRAYCRSLAYGGNIALDSVTGALNSPQTGSPNATTANATLAPVVPFKPAANNPARNFGLIKKTA